MPLGVDLGKESKPVVACHAEKELREPHAVPALGGQPSMVEGQVLREMGDARQEDVVIRTCEFFSYAHFATCAG